MSYEFFLLTLISVYNDFIDYEQRTQQNDFVLSNKILICIFIFGLIKKINYSNS